MAQTVFCGGEEMDKFPLCWKESAVGTLTAERDGLYTWFSANGKLPEDGLWSAWVIGEAGELRLGVLEPCGECGEIRRRYSARLVNPLGCVCRGEIRKAEEPGQRKDLPFRTVWLREMLLGIERYQVKQRNGFWYLAIPYSASRPFPLPPLFCLGQILQMEGEDWVVFCFDETEWPVIPGKVDKCLFSSL